MNKQNNLETYRRMGKNFMTPEIISYVMTSDGRIVELSRGTGIDGTKIWGVSEFDTEVQPTKRGQMFYNYISAKSYFNTLLGAF